MWMRKITVALPCLCLGFLVLCGCTNNVSTQNMESNTLYHSVVSDKEFFYLQSSERGSLLPYEIHFDEDYQLMSAKLYCFQDGAWKLQERKDIELQGDTFWFLVSSSLNEAYLMVCDVDVLEAEGRNIDPGIVFEKHEPSFTGEQKTEQYRGIESVQITEKEEVPVVASVISTGTDSLEPDPEDFYHPESLTIQEDQEAYYLMTFTFLR